MARVSRVLKRITTGNAQGGERRRNRRIDTTPNTKEELSDSSTVRDSLLLQTRSVSAPIAGQSVAATQAVALAGRARRGARSRDFAVSLKSLSGILRDRAVIVRILVPEILQPFWHVADQVVILLCGCGAETN